MEALDRLPARVLASPAIVVLGRAPRAGWSHVLGSSPGSDNRGRSRRYLQLWAAAA